MAQMDEEEKELDPTEVKKAEKERKKQEKKQGKENKKKEKDYAADMEEEETVGSKMIIIAVSLAIVLVWIAIFALLIKWDIGGFGSSVLYPVLKDVPYVNRILPEVHEENDPYAYSSIEEAVARIKELELQISSFQESSGANEDTVTALQDEVARLKVYEQERAEFENIRRKFYEEVVFGDDAPDIKEYKQFYESIDPETAAALYKQVVSQMEEDEAIKEYAKTYSSMKAKDAAAIMEEMTDNLTLVAKILENMNAESRGAILGAMNPSVAASVTKLMEP